MKRHVLGNVVEVAILSITILALASRVIANASNGMPNPMATFITAIPAPTSQTSSDRNATLLAAVQNEGKIQVLVMFKVPGRKLFALFGYEADLSVIKFIRRLFLATLPGNVTVLSTDDWFIPSVWLVVDEPALRVLIASPFVETIEPNVPIELHISAPVTVTPSRR